MVAITATNSTTVSLQSVLLKTRLDQARREADQAEATAQDLQAQADAAESQAQQSRGRVRDLSRGGQPLDPTYKLQLQDSQSNVTPNAREIFVSLYQATSLHRAAAGDALKISSNAGFVVNPQGQATGRIVNLSA